ncbi:hypothetical protein NDU88_002937 [Pleurodeles waltl]|uniref:Uncharacterized protein n=1 Tax=Pleurodeles waltl TaxID=8319 RepID=A0AAV7RH59_PLEWA|nr:hypothetical protein NDU88_002937 [Pleurodeles waltl]
MGEVRGQSQLLALVPVGPMHASSSQNLSDLAVTEKAGDNGMGVEVIYYDGEMLVQTHHLILEAGNVIADGPGFRCEVRDLGLGGNVISDRSGSEGTEVNGVVRWWVRASEKSN